MAGMFDDLIPKQQGASGKGDLYQQHKSSLSFDDLIPQKSVGDFALRALPKDIYNLGEGAVNLGKSADDVLTGGITNGINALLPASMQFGQKNPATQHQMTTASDAASLPMQILGSIKGAADLGTGAVTRGLNHILPSSMQITPQNADQQHMLDMVDNAGGAISNAVSAPEARTQTLNSAGDYVYNHPVGTAANLAAILSGGGALAEGAGATRLASGLRTAGEFANPINMVGKPIKTLGGIVTAPIRNNILAYSNPEGFAASKIAKDIAESGKSPQELAAALQSAASEGQPNFALVDAMGNPGQRRLAAVARTPGDGRTEAVNFLENRQAGQARSLSNILSEGLAAPKTAAQTQAEMTAQRSSQANANYGAARNGAGPVDVSPAINAADNYLRPGANAVVSTPSGVADNSISSAVAKAKSFLTDGKSNVSDFDSALNAKHEIQNLMDTGSPSQATFLKPIRDALDQQLSDASPSYANARNTFRQQSQAIESIDQGKAAAMRGRPEDTLGAYNKMPADQQAAYRVGYSDPTIEKITNAPVGNNKARILMGDGPQAELNAMSQFSDPSSMARRIGRENTMFETRGVATGGSTTADNLADISALSHAPGIIGNLLHGNVMGAAKGIMNGLGDKLTGNTEEVRSALAKMLLTHGINADVSGMLAKQIAGRKPFNAKMLGRALVAGQFGGHATAPQ